MDPHVRMLISLILRSYFLQIITLLASNVHALPAMHTAELELQEPIAKYLDTEPCDLYITGMIPDMSLLQKPVMILDKGLQPPTFPGGCRYTCRAIVIFSKESSVLQNLTKSNYFQKVHWIWQHDHTGPNLVPHVDLPTTVYTTNGNDQTNIFIMCPNSRKLQAINIWTPKREDFIRPIDGSHCPNILKGMEVQVAATGFPPFLIHTDQGFTGVDPAIMDILANRMGFTYNISMFEPISGVKVDGSWTGVVGKVVSGEAQFGIGDVAMTIDLFKDVDFTATLYPFECKLFTFKPNRLSSYMNFTHPFNGSTWLALLGSIILATATYAFVRNVFLLPDEKRQYLWQALTNCFQVQFTQQGAAVNSTRLSPWIIFGIYCIFAAFTNAFYVCDFVVYLMQAKYEDPIDSEQDILNLNGNLFLQSGSGFAYMFQTSPLDYQQEVFNMTVERKTFYAIEDDGDMPKHVLDRVIENRGALITGSQVETAWLSIFNKMYNGSNMFRIGKKTIFQFYGGFAVQRRVLWKQGIDEIIYGLVQGGILDRLQAKFLDAKFLQKEVEDSSPIAIDVDHLFGPMLVLIVCLAFCFIAFLVELYYWNKSRPDAKFKIPLKSIKEGKH